MSYRTLAGRALGRAEPYRTLIAFAVERSLRSLEDARRASWRRTPSPNGTTPNLGVESERSEVEDELGD